MSRTYKYCHYYQSIDDKYPFIYWDNKAGFYTTQVNKYPTYRFYRKECKQFRKNQWRSYRHKVKEFLNKGWEPPLLPPRTQGWESW